MRPVKFNNRAFFPVEHDDPRRFHPGSCYRGPDPLVELHLRHKDRDWQWGSMLVPHTFTRGKREKRET